MDDMIKDAMDLMEKNDEMRNQDVVLEPHEPESKCLEEFFFPVGYHKLYFGKSRDSVLKEQIGYVELGWPEVLVDEEKMEKLSLVSSSYMLITNKEAFNLGMKVAQIIFGEDKVSGYIGGDFLTRNRASCCIEIGTEQCVRNGDFGHCWKPFLNVINSYDNSRPLSLQVGLRLDTEDGKSKPFGVIVPSLSVCHSFRHTWEGVKLPMRSNMLLDAVIDVKREYDVGGEFMKMIQVLMEIELGKDDIIPLFCRLFDKRVMSRDSYKKTWFSHCAKEFEKIGEKWFERCGNNAYSVLCAFVQFVSEYSMYFTELGKMPILFQRQIGCFVDEMVAAKVAKGKMFNISDFVDKKYIDLLDEILRLADKPLRYRPVKIIFPEPLIY